ncbi:uncharacterized protein [Cicer arietinum]|uniref:uncharacterized protein n=1 Tax=Cicer arietinum TaxID=3827 RepID=UPI003CC591D7
MDLDSETPITSPSPPPPSLPVTTTRTYQHDMLDPYFMHPSDNPSVALISLPLSASNYHSWSRSMIVALRSKNKLGFVNGSLPRPSILDRLSMAWDRCNTMLISWMTNSLEPDIAQSVMWMDSVAEIWSGLCERYHHGDVFRISDLQEEIYGLQIPTIANVSNSNRANSRESGDTGGRSSGSSGRPSKYFSHCHRSGPTVDVCFCKHGFPPHFRKNGNSSANNCVASDVDNDDKKSSCADDSLGPPICNIWHNRLGHASFDVLNHKNKSFPFVRISKSISPCDVCFHAKHKCLPFPNSTTIADCCFDLIHMDIWGPFSMPSILGYKYFLTVVDDKSRFCWDKLPSSIPIINPTSIDSLFDLPPTPIRLSVSNRNLVCKLQKSLYELKQASCQWNFKLCSTLFDIGFIQSKSDYSLFTKRTSVSNRNLVCKLQKSLYELKQASCQWNFKLCSTLFDIGFIQSKSDYSLFTKRTSVSNRNLVCKLQKSLYELKQASCQWNFKLCSTLFDIGFIQSKSDYSLFTKRTSVSNRNLVCKLQKSLYELKQASCQWNFKLCSTLFDIGFIQSKSDYSLFTKRTSVSNRNLVCKLQKSLYELKQASCQWNFKLCSTLFDIGFIQSKSDYSLFTKRTSVSNRNLVCKLQKSLYGLKQVSRQWNFKLCSTLFDIGFIQSKSDCSLFTKRTSVSNRNLVCKLQKSLYGLKQVSRQWNFKLCSTLFDIGFIQYKSDYSLFTKRTSVGFTIILIYVDDLLIAGDDLVEVNIVKEVLHSKFSIRDLGTLKYFIGLEVARSFKGISICQRKYSLDLLEDMGLLACKPASTPIDPTLKLHLTSCHLLSDPLVFRQLIGKLLYLTHTRPDISFDVCRLSQLLSAPTDLHLQTAFRILRYIKSSPGHGLFYSSNSTFNLMGFCDFDGGTCLDTRRSTSGFCFYLGSSLVSWKSKKQPTVSCSSSEAEYTRSSMVVIFVS